MQVQNSTKDPPTHHMQQWIQTSDPHNKRFHLALSDVFSKFGEVTDIHIQRRYDDGMSLTFGFVSFSSCKAAAKAKRQLNGTYLLGVTMRIAWTQCSTNHGYICISECLANRHSPTENCCIASSQVHMSFISEQADVLMTEEVARSLFSSFGLVESVCIVKSTHSIKKSLSVDDVEKKSDDAVQISPLYRQSGHGFVHFTKNESGIHSATIAIRQLNENIINGVSFDCAFSRNVKYNEHLKVEKAVSPPPAHASQPQAYAYPSQPYPFFLPYIMPCAFPPAPSHLQYARQQPLVLSTSTMPTYRYHTTQLQMLAVPDLSYQSLIYHQYLQHCAEYQHACYLQSYPYQQQQYPPQQATGIVDVSNYHQQVWRGGM